MLRLQPQSTLFPYTTLFRSVAKFDFWGKIQKSGIRNSTTYRLPRPRKSNFATEPFNEQLASEFLQDRSRRCRPHLHDRAALRRLLEHLRHQGIIPIPIVQTDTYDSDRLVGDFQHYLIEQRCLAPTTVDYYLKTVQSFLRERFSTQPLNLEALCPQDITDFMIRQARRYSSGRAKLFATALRSFFRFLLQRGAIAHDLAQAVPTVPNWRLTTLPRFMKLRIDTLCHEGLTSQKVMRFPRLIFRKQNMPQTV